jgi:hypothetical protein
MPLVPTYGLVFNLALALIVYHDQRLNGRSGIGWAAIVFLTSIFGFVAYFFFNRDTLQLAGQRYARRKLKESLESKSPPPRRMDPHPHRVSVTPFGEPVDDGFADPKLDNLVGSGRLKEARAYLDKMLELGRGMGDNRFVEKYGKYEEDLGEIERGGQG